MKIVKPYVNEHYELIFIEFKNKDYEDIVNGVIGGILLVVVLFISKLLFFHLVMGF